MGTTHLPEADAHHTLQSTGVDIHVAEWSAPRNPRLAVLLIPGTGSHVGYYGRFANELRLRGIHVFAVDFKGHGRSGGKRGVFTLSEMVQNCDDAAAFIKTRTGLRVAGLGTSQGGETAFHALQASANIDAGISHNILLSTLFPINAKVRLLQSGLVGAVATLLPFVRIPLKLAFNWKKAYLDPNFLAEKEKDPLAVWFYSLPSYRSVFTTAPVVPPAGNHKPVLVACGERDELVTPAHCLRCFTAMGGPKEFYVMPGAGHQLVIDYSAQFADVVSAFLKRHLEDAPHEPMATQPGAHA